MPANISIDMETAVVKLEQRSEYLVAQCPFCGTQSIIRSNGSALQTCAHANPQEGEVVYLRRAKK